MGSSRFGESIPNILGGRILPDLLVPCWVGRAQRARYLALARKMTQFHVKVDAQQ